MRDRRRLLGRLAAVAALTAMLVGTVGGPASAARSQQPPDGTISPHVVGGQPATPGQLPFLAAVVAHDEPRAYEGQFCGATVVAPNWVMTAWHCVLDQIGIVEEPDGRITTISFYLPPSALDVVVGVTDLGRPGGQRVQAAQIVPHPSAGVGLGSGDILFPLNDVALIRLKSPLVAPPVRLATGADAALATPPAQATVVGWGTTNDPGGKTLPTYPSVAHVASVPIVGDAACSAAHGRAYVKSTQVCAGAPGVGIPGVGSCYGDSGGPLAARDGSGAWVQLGVVSFGGETCASNGKPGVYARVSAFSDWVKGATAHGPFAGPGPFVAGQLLDFTNARPTMNAIWRWTATLDRTSPSSVIRQLAAGTAWQRTAGVTDRLYRAALGRTGDTGGMNLWTKRLAAGTPPSRLGDALVSSSEFRLRVGQLSDAAYVDHLYRSVLAKSPEPANRATWLRRLRAGTTRGEVLTTFAAQPAFTTRIAADAQVSQVWYGMLRSAPTAAHVAKWRGRPDEMVRYVLASPAYLGRTWPGINDTDYSTDIDTIFSSASAAGRQVRPVPVDGPWPEGGLRLVR